MILDRFKITGRTAVVTGAGRGIGKAIALALAEAGADVVCGARTLEQVEATVAAVRDRGRKGVALKCDVLKSEDRDALVGAALSTFGRLDILVNNAGGWMPQPALQTTDKDFDAAFRFNVSHAFSMTRIAAPKMVETTGAGTVINISSLAGLEPWPMFSAYGTAKAALNFLTREMAQDFAPKVRVNAIACGSIETDALGSVLTDEIRQTMIDMTPMGRIGQVEDIAACAVYLASDAASFVTGEIVGVHGGTNGLNMRMPRTTF
jgi:7-alpha-hydroxysteroid dehydrogenase